MIYTPPPDTFSYLEGLDENEMFYKQYLEAKGDKEKINKLIGNLANPRAYLIPEVYPDVAALQVRTLFDEYYPHAITIRKHTRYSPDIMHDHSYFEMVYMLKGKADNTIEDTLYTMTDGDICLIPPNVFHKIWVNDDNSILINIIMKKSLFEESFLNEFLQGNNIIKFIKRNLFMQSLDEKKFLMFHSLHNANLINVLALMISETFKGQNNMMTKKALLTCILNYLTSIDVYEEDSEDTERAYSILEFIQKNYSTVTLSTVAKHFNYSEPYLSKLIQNITGVSFISILQTTKLKEACHLLATTNHRISDIPSMVGYESPVYFNRVFKQKVGTTPYKYRKMHKSSRINLEEDMFN